MTGDEPADGDGAFRRILLGQTGFERAAVWSAVGMALSYVAFDALGWVGVESPLTVLALAVVTAVGALAFAATGGGALPTALLAYGPFAGTLLRAVGPTPYVSPLAVDGPSALAVAEPLGLAVAVAVAVGFTAAVIGFLVGRIRG